MSRLCPCYEFHTAKDDTEGIPVEQMDCKCACHQRDAEMQQLRDRVESLEAENARLRAAENAAFHAFVAGAKWWEYKSTGGTMWPSDLREVEEEAKRHYPYAPHLLVVEAQKKLEAAERELDRLRAVAEAAKKLYMLHKEDLELEVDDLQRSRKHIDAEDELFAAIDALEEAKSGE